MALSIRIRHCSIRGEGGRAAQADTDGITEANRSFLESVIVRSALVKKCSGLFTMNRGKRLKIQKSMRQICPKCGYEKCVPKLYIDNHKYPSGSILRCKQCKSLFSLKNGEWTFWKEWD